MINNQELLDQQYDIVDGHYLYNRCHLIGYQLTGENANRKNLITGTRYMNVDGMLPFENIVADYVKETKNHVMYRVTPIFDGENLVANGVLIEAKSVEDDGEGIEFCVYVYNNQPGIVIDYATGESKLDDGTAFPEKPPVEDGEEDGDDAENGDTHTYIINKSTKKIHKEDCRYATDIKEENKEVYTGKLEDLLTDGDFTACGTCKPE
jgi:DNA-entry nuclease